MSSTSAVALIWWVIPITAVLGATIYGVWVTKYKSKYDNQTNRSVNKFSKFQNSFRHKK
ncbi:hypothetical protein [Candidatus Nanopelagicus hibericus]|uniref:hypothetical protein n=1 Tax=Candidatus Nanopelagicus hibericus TaxID=1884915 RepID=UPI00167FDF42|nr:hypothetical protein [Candidatus Nanopelagicus hibericus]